MSTAGGKAPNTISMAACCPVNPSRCTTPKAINMPAIGRNTAAPVALALDRHANGEAARTVALRCLREDGSCRELTYSQLAVRANRFANVLRALGVGEGARIFVLAARGAELYEVVLGALKAKLATK